MFYFCTPHKKLKYIPNWYIIQFPSAQKQCTCCLKRLYGTFQYHFKTNSVVLHVIFVSFPFFFLPFWRITGKFCDRKKCCIPQYGFEIIVYPCGIYIPPGRIILKYACAELTLKTKQEKTQEMLELDKLTKSYIHFCMLTTLTD